MSGFPRVRSGFTALALGLGLFGCQADEQGAESRFTALGTEVEIAIADGGDADTEAALADARERLKQIGAAWYPYGDGELAQLNKKLAAGKSFQGSPELITLLERAKEMERLSEGRFNPAIGGLIEVWGFSTADGPLDEPPEADAIEQWLERRPRTQDLRWDAAGTISTSNDAVQLDLGGIGKGYAAQQTITLLREHGVAVGIVNLGGDILTLGSPADRSWRIGVRDPREGTVLAAVEAHANEAVFTSGDYERTFIHEDRRYHHILDPTTGYPAMGSRSVTVIHDDAVLADAAATSLFIAGPEHWRDVADRMGVEHVLLIDREGAVHMTEAMEPRVEFMQEPELHRSE